LSDEENPFLGFWNEVVIVAKLQLTDMSVTTTSNPPTGSVLQVLADYDVHHSGSPESSSPGSGPNTRPSLSRSIPSDWPTNHRGVPPYRAVDRNLDREQRPGGLNGPEAVFIFTMLNGVRINSVRHSCSTEEAIYWY